MTEQPEQDDPAAPGPSDPPGSGNGAPLRTGNPRVDAVLDSLEQLAEGSPDGHVPVFERAHEELRRALDALPERPAAGDVDGASDAAADGAGGPEGG